MKDTGANTVKILHLSDLHFGAEPGKGLGETAIAQRENVLEDLINVLANQKKDWRPDMAVISGDIGWKGKKEDYKKAGSWLEKNLLGALDLKSENLIICPGNHDLEEDSFLHESPVLEHIEADKRLKPERLKYLSRDFEEFIKFCKNMKIKELSLGGDSSYLTGYRDILGIRFVVLNSAWFSREGDDRNRLWIGQNFLEFTKSKKQIVRHNNKLFAGKDYKIAIAVFHHPKEWLNFSEYTATATRNGTVNMLSEYCHLLFCGHEHPADIREPDSVGRKMQIFKGGATYSDKTDSNIFSILKLDFNTKKMQQRVFEYIPKKESWSIDDSEEMSILSGKPQLAASAGLEPEDIFSQAKQYLNLLKEQCCHMDLKKLRESGKSRVITVTLPEVFIPLYANDPQEQKNVQNKEQEKTKPADIEKLIIKYDHLLIEGHPGSGKTTLLKHFAYLFVKEEVKELVGALPILILLKDLKKFFDQRSAESFNEITAEEILAFHLENKGLSLEALKIICKEKRAVFLLDGLDEISPEYRDIIGKAFGDFRTKNKGVKVVLSGRPHGISGVCVQRFGKNHVNILNLDMKQVEEFIRRWFKFVYEKAETVGQENAESMIAEVRAHPSIDKLIDNPLMLTAICILYNDGKTLPGQRAELYRNFVDNMLHRRFKKDEPQKVLDFLMLLAFDMHEKRLKGADKTFAVKRLAKVYGANKRQAEVIFDRVEPQCGLLRFEGSQYVFWHLTFQEFLTARHLITITAESYNDAISPYWDNEWYKEVIQLYIGFLSIENRGVANGIVSKIISNDKSKTAHQVLAAKSFEDMHFGTRDASVGSKTKKRLIEIIKSDIDPKIKAEAGETLGWLGDTRKLKKFVEIPGGEYNLEKLGKVKLDAFRISKYPVTNAWYEEFINGKGYETLGYWSDEGKKFLKKEGIQQPRYWDERKWRCPNAPVVGVSWYEAIAFCNWFIKHKNNGGKYSLPTEQQWQAAAAGFDKRKYPWGEGIDSGRCNYAGKIGKTSSVGIFEKGKTPEGVYDMSGNVWEWCLNRRADDSSLRVMRGGSWYYFARYCRCAYRGRPYPAYRLIYAGFRLVFVP